NRRFHDELVTPPSPPGPPLRILKHEFTELSLKLHCRVTTGWQDGTGAECSIRAAPLRLYGDTRASSGVRRGGRPPANAPGQPLDSAVLAAPLDGAGNAGRRRLAVVCGRLGRPVVRR